LLRNERTGYDKTVFENGGGKKKMSDEELQLRERDYGCAGIIKDHHTFQKSKKDRWEFSFLFLVPLSLRKVDDLDAHWLRGGPCHPGAWIVVFSWFAQPSQPEGSKAPALWG